VSPACSDGHIQHNQWLRDTFFKPARANDSNQAHVQAHAQHRLQPAFVERILQRVAQLFKSFRLFGK
jgi:hypothetical protein